MARPRSDGLKTEFGRVLDRLQIPYESVADDLGLSKTHVGNLARGEILPKLALVFDIQDWAKKRRASVTPSSWRRAPNHRSKTALARRFR